MLRAVDQPLNPLELHHFDGLSPGVSTLKLRVRPVLLPMMRRPRTHASGRLKDRLGLGRISRLGGPVLGYMVMPLLPQPVAARPTPLPGCLLDLLWKRRLSRPETIRSARALAIAG